MTTKPPAKVKPENSDSTITKIYDLTEELKESIPVQNDRNRLGFCLYRYITGEAHSITEAVQSAKPSKCTMNIKELTNWFSNKFKELNLIPE